MNKRQQAYWHWQAEQRLEAELLSVYDKDLSESAFVNWQLQVERAEEAYAAYQLAILDEQEGV